MLNPSIQERIKSKDIGMNLPMTGNPIEDNITLQDRGNKFYKIFFL